MAHSSLPIYLDPPNWHQQSNQQPTNDHQDPRQLPPFLPPPPPHVGGATGSIRPGSMAYRARLAMIPQPEAALKCPRCESINTKFCYFNNYSLSQPRHFCKTCRRYWTLGGALRNVPVGGGFRKNKKKKKSNRSKSPAGTESEIGNSRSNGGIISAGCNIGSSTIGRLPSPQLPSMASLQILPRLGAGNSGSGLNFNGIQIGNMNSSGGDLDQWRSQQYPFIISGLESPATAAAAAYPFIQTDQANFGVNNSSASAIQYCHQFQNLTPFYRETNHQLKNEEKQNQDQGILPNFLRPPAATVTENNNQFWTGHDQNSWTDLSALSSSSSSRLL